jgi:hypothetical protein
MDKDVPRWDGKESILEYASRLPPTVPGVRNVPIDELSDAELKECRRARDEADERSAKRAAKDTIDALCEGSTVDSRKAQSPIELKMLAAFVECGFNTDVSKASSSLATLYQQHPIVTDCGTIHPDFAVVRRVGRRTVQVAIELDGHAFHQLTKEQVAVDYRRGRAMSKAGWIVVRFTGSEVWRDPGAVALEVAGIVIEAVARIKEGR